MFPISLLVDQLTGDQPVTSQYSGYIWRAYCIVTGKQILNRQRLNALPAYNLPINEVNYLVQQAGSALNLRRFHICNWYSWWTS